jgi:hypothetical protein
METNKMNKKYIPHIVIAFLVTIICLFGGSYYNKSERKISTLEKQLSFKEVESRSLQMQNWELERQKVDLQIQIEAVKESKDIEISEGKRVDGSKYKITKIKTNKEKSMNNSNSSVESKKESNTNVAIKEEKKIELKETIKDKKDEKKSETKKSGATKWVVLGGIAAACLLGFIPACAGLL